MRYVDIDELDPSPEWKSRATKALDELRKEIENAELAAQLSGEDVVLASLVVQKTPETLMK